ncbi:DUF3617 domain-containing protein [Bdellovibrio sp. HCB-110]|uniref:DUF3617 domain-containing protein n=1 Tax=Bdellovibrio sp. HCB-110 TaxID=3391182 RepID=UPI0039B67C69
MKILLVILTLSYAVPSLAFDIKPGLWEVQTVVTYDGKQFDPQAEIKKAMAAMSPEQRKQMEALMKKGAGGGSGFGGLSENGFRICYTKAMLNDPKKVMESSKKCKMDLKSQTSTKLTGTFNCPDDKTSGTFDWTVKNQNLYEGLMTGKTKDGKTSLVRQNAKFVSADCGSVKPEL